MMYWLFRLHNIKPTEFNEMGRNEKKILIAFTKQELEDMRKENESG